MPLIRLKRENQKDTQKKRERGRAELIRERVLQAVLSLGDTATVQAMQLGVARSTRERWFKPNALPTIPHLLRIAERTGSSLSWVLALDAVDGDSGKPVELSDNLLTLIKTNTGSDTGHKRNSARTTGRSREWVDSAAFRSSVEVEVDKALRGLRKLRSTPANSALPPWAERIRRTLTRRSEGLDTLCLRAVRAEVFDAATRYRKAMLDLADLMTVDSSRVFEPGLDERLRKKAKDIRRFADTLSSFEAMVHVIPEIERVGPLVGAAHSSRGTVVLESRFEAVAPALSLVFRGKRRDYAWYLELHADEAAHRDRPEMAKPKLCPTSVKRGRFLTPRAGMSFVEQLAVLTGDHSPFEAHARKPSAPLPDPEEDDEENENDLAVGE
jgi:hypothetical protein